MKTNLEQRISTLEKMCGGTIAAGIVHETSATVAGLTACGETWTRRPGESDEALRKRALGDLLKIEKSVLVRKTMLHYADLMRKATNAGPRGRSKYDGMIREGKITQVNEGGDSWT
ncbi:MAG: hypothetical protein Q8K00_08345 [Syntrophales bacterium]|nr:hypothetical protein [Syntrophales bacterium]